MGGNPRFSETFFQGSSRQAPNTKRDNVRMEIGLDEKERLGKSVSEFAGLGRDGAARSLSWTR